MILETISSRDLLIDAYKFYLRGDARAHDALAIIVDRNDMNAAVLGCLERAKGEEDPSQQRIYLNAACFGKKFHPGVAINEYQSVCRRLRVRNICQTQVLAPSMDPQENIDQLIEKKSYDLADWVCDWTNCDSKEKVLNRWIEDLIRKRHIRDEELASIIQQKLGRESPIPYADVANKAIEFNRVKLAIRLLENEDQTSKKIPLLLGIKQYDLVLAQAVATCDSNSIYSAIFKLKDLIGNEINFLELLKKHRHAFKYYNNFLVKTDIKKLIKIQYTDGGKEDLMLHLLSGSLESALGVSRRSKQDFISHQIESQLKLNKFQQSLKQIDPPPINKNSEWLGLSISDTIINLIALGHSSKAKDCQRKFEVSDRKYKILEQVALNCLPKLELPSANNR